MLPFKKILFPTDFSEPSYEGLRQAVELSSHFGAQFCLVHVMHIVPMPADEFCVFDKPTREQEIEADVERKLNELIEEWIPINVKASTVVGHGRAAKEIVRIAGDECADLIVIANHRLKGWRRLVSGSVTRKIMRLASCPVLAIGQPRRQRRSVESVFR